MSSNSYWSCLTPDPDLRLVVDVAAQLLIAASIALVLTMSLGVLPRFGAALACLGLGRFELLRLRRGFRCCREIRLASDGSALLRDEDGRWVVASLRSGSLVLPRLAWLRLRTVSGVLVTELVCGDSRTGQDWRRLQVIWRHIGGSE